MLCAQHGAQAAALVAQVDRPKLWLALRQPSTPTSKNAIPHGAIVAHRPNYIHISENDRGIHGRGHIDMAAVFAALRTIGHNGGSPSNPSVRPCPIWPRQRASGAPLFDTEAEVYEESIKLIRNYWT